MPELEAPQKIADGAKQYVAMCAGCHLTPGMQNTEIRRGLYPQPLNLAQPADIARSLDYPDPQTAARRQFWIIKHGIKMTGMPAWGITHDDEAIWNLVAFLQKLPAMSPEQYASFNVPGTAATAHKDPSGTKPHTHDH